MRRFFLLAFLALLIIPAAAFAQDATPEATSQAMWDLTPVFTVTDLGFQFHYPAGWVQDTSSGITLAENQDDLNASVDKDDTTNPQGYTMSLNGVPLDALKLKPDAKLDDVVDLIVGAAGITETESRFDLAVMSRRSVTVVGKGKDGRVGLANIWIQDGIVVVFTLGGPEMNGDVYYTWGLIIGSMSPTGALEFSDTPLASPNGDFTMSIPKDWFTDAKQPGVAVEKKDDLSSSSSGPHGFATVMIEGKLSDISPDAKDLTDLAAFVVKAQSLDETVVPVEQIVLGVPALTYTAPSSKKDGSINTYTVVLREDGTAVIIGLYSASEDDFKTIWPTYLAMLSSAKAVAK